MWYRSLLLAACSCNAVYGLDETISADRDRDRDGIVDTEDNCAQHANRDQADGDRDRVGDACDACVAVFDRTNHDEDGDGFGDPCDNCPGVVAFQVDADGDGVGDACAARRTGLTRQVFDPLITLDAWMHSGTWRSLGDSVAPSAPLPDDDPGLELATAAVSSANLYTYVNLGVRSVQTWAAGDRLAVVFRDVRTSAEAARCDVFCDVNGCPQIRATLFGTSATVLPNGVALGPQMRLWAEIASIGGVAQITCGLDDAFATATPQRAEDFAWRPALVTVPDIQLSYFELLD